ncbi:hypothetical protein [Streptomyces zhaozhouensis]|nr:hypothetical protein [Streptomyces zhaozhouensis]
MGMCDALAPAIDSITVGQPPTEVPVVAVNDSAAPATEEPEVAAQ